MNDEPLAYFLTWTVYGTFLQGDPRGWWKRGEGTKPSQPELSEWRSERLSHPVLLLNPEHRKCVNDAIQQACRHLAWKLWACNARSNHVHVVVHARRCEGSAIRNQLKASSTRALWEQWPQYRDRPVWTEGGDWKCINDEIGLERVIQYVCESQDRKSQDTPTDDVARMAD